MALTDIADRLTPSVPIEITFGSQPVAVGRKITTIFGHKAAAGATAMDYAAYMVQNVGDPVAALAEVNALAGAGSQLGQMVQAFISANSLVGRANFPAIRIVFIPFAQASFGPASEALVAVQLLRSDMFVSCYPATDSANATKLLGLAATISGPDRDLNGQFGSFVTFGSIDALSTVEALNLNSRLALIGYLQDTNNALVSVDGNLTLASNIITGIVTTGINLGATITGTGIPAGALVGAVDAVSVTMVDASGNPVNATATEAAEMIAFQNLVSQAPEIVAACHAAGMMQSAQPYNPLQGVAIGFLVPPRKQSDWIPVDPNGPSEQLLIAGVSPLTIQPGGVVAFIRTRTTYTTLPGNITVNAYFDWQDLVVINDFREACYQICQNPPFNNNPGGTKASQTVANLLKDEILREAQAFEDDGMFQGVKTLAPLFLVQPSSTSRGRFDFKIPVNVLPGLYVIAGNIQAVTGIGDFTL